MNGDRANLIRYQNWDAQITKCLRSELPFANPFRISQQSTPTRTLSITPKPPTPSRSILRPSSVLSDISLSVSTSRNTTTEQQTQTSPRLLDPKGNKRKLVRRKSSHSSVSRQKKPPMLRKGSVGKGVVRKRSGTCSEPKLKSFVIGRPPIMIRQGSIIRRRHSKDTSPLEKNSQLISNDGRKKVFPRPKKNLNSDHQGMDTWSELKRLRESFITKDQTNARDRPTPQPYRRWPNYDFNCNSISSITDSAIFMRIEDFRSNSENSIEVKKRLANPHNKKQSISKRSIPSDENAILKQSKQLSNSSVKSSSRPIDSKRMSQNGNTATAIASRLNGLSKSSSANGTLEQINSSICKDSNDKLANSSVKSAMIMNTLEVKPTIFPNDSLRTGSFDQFTLFTANDADKIKLSEKQSKSPDKLSLKSIHLEEYTLSNKKDSEDVVSVKELISNPGADNLERINSKTDYSVKVSKCTTQMLSNSSVNTNSREDNLQQKTLNNDKEINQSQRLSNIAFKYSLVKTNSEHLNVKLDNSIDASFMNKSFQESGNSQPIVMKTEQVAQSEEPLNAPCVGDCQWNRRIFINENDDNEAIMSSKKIQSASNDTQLEQSVLNVQKNTLNMKLLTVGNDTGIYKTFKLDDEEEEEDGNGPMLVGVRRRFNAVSVRETCPNVYFASSVENCSQKFCKKLTSHEVVPILTDIGNLNIVQLGDDAIHQIRKKCHHRGRSVKRISSKKKKKRNSTKSSRRKRSRSKSKSRKFKSKSDCVGVKKKSKKKSTMKIKAECKACKVKIKKEKEQAKCRKVQQKKNRCASVNNNAFEAEEEDFKITEFIQKNGREVALDKTNSNNKNKQKNNNKRVKFLPFFRKKRKMLSNTIRYLNSPHNSVHVQYVSNKDVNIVDDCELPFSHLSLKEGFSETLPNSVTMKTKPLLKTLNLAVRTRKQKKQKLKKIKKKSVDKNVTIRKNKEFNNSNTQSITQDMSFLKQVLGRTESSIWRASTPKSKISIKKPRDSLSQSSTLSSPSEKDIRNWLNFKSRMNLKRCCAADENTSENFRKKKEEEEHTFTEMDLYFSIDTVLVDDDVQPFRSSNAIHAILGSIYKKYNDELRKAGCSGKRAFAWSSRAVKPCMGNEDKVWRVIAKDIANHNVLDHFTACNTNNCFDKATLKASLTRDLPETHPIRQMLRYLMKITDRSIYSIENIIEGRIFLNEKDVVFYKGLPCLHMRMLAPTFDEIGRGLQLLQDRIPHIAARILVPSRLPRRYWREEGRIAPSEANFSSPKWIQAIMIKRPFLGGISNLLKESRSCRQFRIKRDHERALMELSSSGSKEKIDVICAEQARMRLYTDNC